MSKIIGITAEYDPFHNGHAYMLKEARRLVTEDPLVIACISGNFTQRGEPALIDKWARAEMAVRQGADLVVEMPFVYACNNAGYFAGAGVEILEALGADLIAFGSETGDFEMLKTAAAKRSDITPEQEAEIRRLAKEGLSYPRALSQVLGETEGLGPNDNLAVEYIRHMKKAEPVAVIRRGAGHGSLDEADSIASATFIRQKLLTGEDLKSLSNLFPPSTYDVLKREFEAYGFCGPEMLYSLIVSKVAASTAEDLDSVYGAEEGLGSKLKDGFRYATDWKGLVWLLKSKRYTMTRIQRVLVHTLTGLTREMVHEAKPYIRVLALNDRGATHLKALKRSSDNELDLPIIENIKTDLKKYPEIRNTFAKEILATDLYNAALRRDLYTNSEYVKKPLKF